MARKKLRILITGSEGRIGRVLSKALDHDYEIFGLDQRGKRPKFFAADISDVKSLAQVFRTIQNLDVIIHLAADPSVHATWESAFKNNIIGTKNIYECARKFSVKRVIFASTNHVTGGWEGFPAKLHKQKKPKKISIRHPLRPDGDYATSKIFGESLARQYYDLFGIKSICLRIGSVLSNDDPRGDARRMKTWLSHKDLIQLVKKSIQAKVPFGIYYGVSKNTGAFWDISNAARELSYRPYDDSAKLV